MCYLSDYQRGSNFDNAFVLAGGGGGGGGIHIPLSDC